MTTWNPKANEIFLSALEIESLDDRLAYLDQAFANEPELRAEVNGLLAAADNAHSFLSAPAAVVAANLNATQVYHPSDASPGNHIGPYKLLEQIGQGGFGTVYMADQTAPVKRRVALKVLKPGMDSKEVIARFEAERQALAMMDHPNIARVLDGGQTPEGRPYFVMELVRGAPITEYCDAARLSNEDRLRLFVDVCRAVQHAHQKGIIHRDLKPSNVMVTLHDDKAVPKVIDFGIAKALHQQLTDRTLFTGYQQLLGTPLYMSPEQAQMSGIDVDTRSDVYSLGVLLYELLTGTTPFTKESLSNASFDELRRIIREDEPPRPSARVTTLEAQARSTIADRRRVDQRRISDGLRRELDWIVMKALEKDRNRRYESASAFAADVERYLLQEPVLACPPSFRYRLSKFVRRQRSRLLTAGLIGCVVLVLSGVLLQGEWSRQQRESQAIQALDSALASANAALTARDFGLAEQYLAEARAGFRLIELNQAEISSRVTAVEGEIEQAKADQETFARFINLARQGMDELSYGTEFGTRRSEESRNALKCYGVLDDDDWTTTLQRRHLSDEQKHQVRETAFELLILLADCMIRWPDIKSESAAREGHRYLDAALQFHEPTKVVHWIRRGLHSYLKEAVKAAAAKALYESTAPTITWDWYLPGHSAGWSGDKEAARLAYLSVLQKHPNHFNSLFFLGARYATDGKFPEAIAYYTACIALRPDHVIARRNRAGILGITGNYTLAEADFLAATKCDAPLAWQMTAYQSLCEFYLGSEQYEKAAPVAKELADKVPSFIEHVMTRIGTDNTELVQMREQVANLSVTLWKAGERQTAIDLQRRIFEVQRRTLANGDRKSIKSMQKLGTIFLNMSGGLDDVIPLLEEAVNVSRQQLGESDPDTLNTMQLLGRCYTSADRQAEAIRTLEEAYAHRESASKGIALDILEYLAGAYLSEKSGDKATPVLTECLERSQQIHGAEHGRTLRIKNSLGLALVQQGNHSTAINLLTESQAALRRQKMELSTSEGQEVVIYLAMAYARNNQAAEARRVLQEQQEGIRQTTDAATLTSWQGYMANQLIEAELHELAEPIAQEFLSAQERLSPRTWQFYSAKSLTGAIRLGQERLDESESLLLEAITGLDSQQATIPPGEWRSIPNTLQRLVALYKAKNDLEQVARWEMRLK